MKTAPFISVVIPNYNQAERLGRCLSALKEQTYSKSHYEIIVVDNGSTDHSIAIARSFGVKLIVIPDMGKPYLCRNAGIREAGGEVIALTDSKCLPRSDWLQHGMKNLLEHPTSVVAGRFEYEFSSPPTVSERAYSLLYLWVVPEENGQVVGGLTGNLFLRKETLEKVGYFREDLRSGGDVELMERIRTIGIKIVYASEAVVSYPAKRFCDLISSAYRIGRGVHYIWPEKSKLRQTLRAFYHMRPLWFGTLKRLIRRRGTPEYNQCFFRLWLVIWLTKINYGRGLLGW